MKSTTYNFDHKIGMIDMKTYMVRDYFQYYHTGVENIILEKPELFNMVDRHDQQRPEQIMHNMFGDEDLADLFVALNNQNYLWSTPFGVNDIYSVIQFRMNYVELLFRKRIERIPNTSAEEGDPNDPETKKKKVAAILANSVDATLVPKDSNKDEWHYNAVGQIMEERTEEYIREQDELQRYVVIPDPDRLGDVKRAVQDYMDKRTV